jgi:hypothetical protein
MSQAMNIRCRILPVILLLVVTLPTAAQTYINPGFKLGYRFGDAGGFVGGVEVSMMIADNKGYHGFVLAADGTSRTLDFHFGVEFGAGIFGICIGPVVSNRPDTTAYGFRVTPYAGFIVVPYYNYQFLIGTGSEHDVGTYLKFSLPNSSGQFGRIGG